MLPISVSERRKQDLDWERKEKIWQRKYDMLQRRCQELLDNQEDLTVAYLATSELLEEARWVIYHLKHSGVRLSRKRTGSRICRPRKRVRFG